MKNVLFAADSYQSYTDQEEPSNDSSRRAHILIGVALYGIFNKECKICINNCV